MSDGSQRFHRLSFEFQGGFQWRFSKQLRTLQRGFMCVQGDFTSFQLTFMKVSGSFKSVRSVSNGFQNDFKDFRGVSMPIMAFQRVS